MNTDDYDINDLNDERSGVTITGGIDFLSTHDRGVTSNKNVVSHESPRQFTDRIWGSEPTASGRTVEGSGDRSGSAPGR